MNFKILIWLIIVSLFIVSCDKNKKANYPKDIPDWAKTKIDSIFERIYYVGDCNPNCITVEEYSNDFDYLYVFRIYADFSSKNYVQIFIDDSEHCTFDVIREDDIPEYMVSKCGTIAEIDKYKFKRTIWKEYSNSY